MYEWAGKLKLNAEMSCDAEVQYFDHKELHFKLGLHSISSRAYCLICSYKWVNESNYNDGLKTKIDKKLYTIA